MLHLRPVGARHYRPRNVVAGKSPQKILHSRHIFIAHFPFVPVQPLLYVLPCRLIVREMPPEYLHQCLPLYLFPEVRIPEPVRTYPVPKHSVLPFRVEYHPVQIKKKCHLFHNFSVCAANIAIPSIFPHSVLRPSVWTTRSIIPDNHLYLHNQKYRYNGHKSIYKPI